MPEKKPPDLTKDKIQLIEANCIERFGEKTPVLLADVTRLKRVNFIFFN